MPRLRRSDCSGPGIHRRRRGRGFEFLDQSGERVTSEETLHRIRELAIPPAWEDVWICPHANGHLQATGIDAAGRKQYLYHSAWRERRDQQKFDEMIEFARALPRIRRKVAADLRRDGLPRERVLACAIRLLDLGFFRIGSESYAEENESYGLATLLGEHVRVNGQAIEFDYVAKGGQHRKQEIVDPDARAVVAALKRRRGGKSELLAYKNGRRWDDVASSDINQYLKDVSGGDFSAKDFRTWNATMIAAVALAGTPRNGNSKAARKRTINEAIRGVAFYLGNTPAVARSSYIDPRVFDRYLSGWTIDPDLAVNGNGSKMGHPSTRSKVEEAVLDLLTERSSENLQKERS
jgi:DNA topoisomerase I